MLKKILAIVFIFLSFVSHADDDQIYSAYENQLSDVQVQSTGIVTRILSDDIKGSQHQRFILMLSTGQTVLIAHNIDIAPRIDSLNTDDIVEFNGVFEWNTKGGVIHWTHHDPANQHEAGWLRHNGRNYQ